MPRQPPDLSFNITDKENVETLAEMIAMESAGFIYASVEQEDVEMAVIAASFIKQLVHDRQIGCVVRGGSHRAF